MSSKSCVHVICVWWLLSVGMSLFLYFLHNLISQILEWANQQRRVEDSYQPSFDDVIEALKGTHYIITTYSKSQIVSKSKFSFLSESGQPFSVELQVSSPLQVRIPMPEYEGQVDVEDDVIIRRVIVTPRSTT